MKSALCGLALAAAVLLGTGDKARAQFRYYTTPYTYSLYNGTLSQGTQVYTPGQFQYGTTFYSPFTGAVGQDYVYRDMYGNNYWQNTGVGPYGNWGYSWYSPGYTWGGRYRPYLTRRYGW